MTSYHHGWAYVAEPNGFQRELFNHARTAAYLQNSSALGCGSVHGVLDDGGCEAYTWVPPQTIGSSVLTDMDGNMLTDDEGNLLIGADLQAPNGWYREDYIDPVNDPAPWYNPLFPESGQALGFWVSEWTGLDSGHIQRQLTQVGGYGGGGVFGATGSAAREMGFEVILLGESEAALDYLYRWLDATISSVCATCATDTILLRRICPTIDPLDYDTAATGVVEMRGVGMMAGLQWGAPPVERAGCFLRRVNFTMAATDPCMYGHCSDVAVAQYINWETCIAAANLNPDRTNCRPTCSEMAASCRTTFDWSIDDPSGGAPVIELIPPVGQTASIPLRIRTYANPNGLLPAELCGAPLLAELYVAALPEWTELRYDIAGRKVQIRNAGTGGWINGFAYVGPNDVGVPRFFLAGCGDYTTTVEPADFCLEQTSDPPDLTGAPAVLSISPLDGGTLGVFGTFTSVAGTTVNRVMKLRPDASLDPAFNVGGTIGVNAQVNASALQSDGKIVIGGAFVTARGTTQNHIARLNTDGTLDTGFNTGGTVGTNAQVNAIAIQSDGKIVIGGNFATVRGDASYPGIARLWPDGTVDTSFGGPVVGGFQGMASAELKTRSRMGCA